MGRDEWRRRQPGVGLGYERFGVLEYWFVDLDENRILVFRLEDGRYAEPHVFGADDLLESKRLPGFAAPVDRLLGVSYPDTS
ncbi:MAG: Uma2 family endonuclease [Egibacteraceae bacterium]